MSQQKIKPGPHKREWVARRWVNKLNGTELTIEADDKDKAKMMFITNVADPHEWKEKK